MSYDLYLISAQLNRDTFARHFEGHPHYAHAGSYANEDTGVYFGFEFVEPESGENSDPETPDFMRAAHVAFNMNYFRPHVFGLEAEPEVTAFVDAFSCTISDPQLGGMGEGAYSPEGFLRGWNEGNAFGYKALGEQAGEGVLYANDSLIEQVWRWNLQREAMQAVFEEVHFLPRLSWARRSGDGATVVFAVWGEGVATALPRCATHALLARKRRAGFFNREQGGVEVKLLSVDEVAALADCVWREGPAGRVLLAPVDIPPSKAVLAAFGGQFAPFDAIATPFAADQVLNVSLMTKIKKPS